MGYMKENPLLFSPCEWSSISNALWDAAITGDKAGKVTRDLGLT